MGVAYSLNPYLKIFPHLIQISSSMCVSEEIEVRNFVAQKRKIISLFLPHGLILFCPALQLVVKSC